MPVNLPALGALLPIDGVQVGAGATGEKGGRLNVAVFQLATGAVAGGVFTQNAFRAPPVAVAEQRMGPVRALVINSGNANAATGERGLADAKATCAHIAAHLGVAENAVAPFSTGVIGEFLNMDALARGVDAALANARPDGWLDAAQAIMTTDTAPKAASLRAEVDGGAVHATGIVKGAGMIAPNMATMLAFLATDAAVSSSVARRLARDLAERSFNRVTVDGDTSTNDCFVVMASGAAAAPPVLDADENRYMELLEALTPLAVDLAQRIVRDAEGATKFVTVRVQGGDSDERCLRVAQTIANSPLVKTALFASDPNWGRFCMAIGNADPRIDAAAVDLFLDDVRVLEGGMRAAEYTEAAGAAVMARDEFTVRVRLGPGDAAQTVWTSDLSHDYVRINADYRT